MLLTALLVLLKSLVMAALMAFPLYELPAGPGLSALSAANIVLPLDVWATMAGATVSLMGASLLIWVIMKGINIIRGSGA